MSDPIARLNAVLKSRDRIERELGEGGMASVYLSDDLKHERKTTLKVLKPELAAVVGAKRFLTEIKMTVNLQHPNILPLFYSGEAGGFLFYIMPYVEGESLRGRLDRERGRGLRDRAGGECLGGRSPDRTEDRAEASWRRCSLSVIERLRLLPRQTGRRATKEPRGKTAPRTVPICGF